MQRWRRPSSALRWRPLPRCRSMSGRRRMALPCIGCGTRMRHGRRRRAFRWMCSRPILGMPIHARRRRITGRRSGGGWSRWKRCSGTALAPESANCCPMARHARGPCARFPPFGFRCGRNAWLGVSRPRNGVGEVRRMVARSRWALSGSAGLPRRGRLGPGSRAVFGSSSFPVTYAAGRFMPLKRP